MDTTFGRFAVVLNMNAKKVTQEVEEISSELVPPEDLFLSASQEDSKRIAETIIARGYETVFAGGGDGTVMGVINELSLYPADKRPAVGILKLGTGNAMARMVSSGDVAGDLKTYITSATREYYWLSLVEADGQRFPFAGMGWDAEILNDYKFVKEKFGGSFMKPMMQTVGGYFFGVFTRTVPRHASRAIRRDKDIVSITVTKGRATEVGAEGTTLAEFEEGQKVYEGPCNIVMAGTVPYYGYGLKILPYANKEEGRFQLRVVTLGTAKALAVLNQVWKGEYAGDDIRDFLVEEAQVHFHKPIPYQVGGDAAGERTDISFKIIPRAIRLLKLL